jgi:hypothetical protein
MLFGLISLLLIAWAFWRARVFSAAAASRSVAVTREQALRIWGHAAAGTLFGVALVVVGNTVGATASTAIVMVWALVVAARVEVRTRAQGSNEY